MKIWVPNEHLGPAGEPVKLRYQMLTRERGTDKKPTPVFLWFVRIPF